MKKLVIPRSYKAQLAGTLFLALSAAVACGDDSSDDDGASGGSSAEAGTGGKAGSAGRGGSSGKGGSGGTAGNESAGSAGESGSAGQSDAGGAAGESSAGAGGEGGSATTPESEKVYLVAKHVSAGEAWTTYLDTATVNSLGELEDFDALDDGIEVDGYVIPVVFHGAAFVPDAVAPTLTRYDLNAAGKLVEGETIGFGGKGLTYVSQSQIAVVSQTKAYLFDAPTRRALIWDPEAMLLTGEEIDLTNDDLLDYDPWFWPDMARLKDGKLLVPVNYGNEDGELNESNLIVIDTETDTVSKFVADDRCQQIHVSVELANGDVYFFPNSGHTEALYMDEPAPRPPICSLRVEDGDDEFDPDYVLELGELAGGDETSGGGAQGAFPDGRGGFYFSVADEARYADREENSYSYYRLWHYDFENATELTEQGWWSGAMSRWTQFGTESVVLNYGADDDGNDFTIVYDGSKDPLAPFQMPGVIEPIARMK